METDGGGWTKIYSVNQVYYDRYNINFPAYNQIPQTEALLVAGSDYFLDYSETNSWGNWRAYGFGLDRTMLRLRSTVNNSVSFLAAKAQYGASCDGEHPATTRSNEATILEQDPHNYCYRGNTNVPSMCASKLKFTLPENTFFIGMTDVESSYGNCYSDNVMKMNYSAYAR